MIKILTSSVSRPNPSPFNNPTETYRYYSLPFCQAHATNEEEDQAAEEENIQLTIARGEKRDGAVRYKQSHGMSLVGDRRETSPYEITFMDSVDWRLLCKTTLETKELEKLKHSIQNNYFFEMFVEDLPMWGYIGDTADEDFIVYEVEGTGRAYLFPHLHFYLGYNKNRIVSAKVTTDVSILSALLNDFVLLTLLVRLAHPITSFSCYPDGSSCRYYRYQQGH